MRWVLVLTVIWSLCGLIDQCLVGNWKDWGSWGPCSENCGGGQMSRSREKCTWYIASDATDWDYKSCNTFCHNGGSYYRNCHCPPWRYGSCCDDCVPIRHCRSGQEQCYSDGAACNNCVDPYYSGGKNKGCLDCGKIDHCVDRHCTTATNVKCRKCEDDKYIFKLSPDHTTCDRRCAWNGHYCWPGTCAGTLGNLTKNCQCALGFHNVSKSTETTCQLNTVNAPSIDKCEVIAIGPNGEKRQAPKTANSSDCQYKVDFFGNYQVQAVQYDYSASFDVNTTYGQPAFISESKFGITDSRIFLQKRNVHGRDVGAKQIQQGIQGNDTTAMTNDYKHDSINVNAALSNGERWCIGFEAKGGGYLINKDLTTQTNSTAQPYQKTTTTRQLCYIFDDAEPTHCKETVGCTYEPMLLSERITRSSVISLTLAGWFDPFPVGGNSSQASGIEHYEVSVHEVTDSGGPTAPLKVSLKSILNVNVPSAVNPVTLNLTLPHPVLYCVSLAVKDVADNIRHARRFVLYDNTSRLTFRDDNPFLVTSASKDTNYTWQVHHNDICLKWKDHFFNEFYFDNQLLKPIGPAPHGEIPVNSIYEQTSGKLPVTGTPNIDGIVGYTLSWAVNEGNMTMGEHVPNFQNQSMCKRLSLKDGQMYTINVRATDIVNNTYSENRTVYIDRTVPQINRVGLSKDGYKRLYVHDSKDLAQMTLEFDALDPHSGVSEIYWTFGTGDGNAILGNGTFDVVRQTCANTSNNCYCPDIGLCEMYNHSISLNSLVKHDKDRGDHNRNYYFTITVTNYARLSNTEHVDILVDESPPETGVVYEGAEDSADIDYTSDSSFLIHWHGFIDHESGIRGYRIALADRCLSKQEFNYMNNATGNDTNVVHEVAGSEKTLRLSANFTGKRYVTVLAINNAMAASIAVCSDGITRDVSAPEIINITIKHGRWSESIACYNNRAWMLTTKLEKVLLHDIVSCQKVCRGETDAMSDRIPTIILPNSDQDISEFMCKNLPRYTADSIIYIPNDNINIQWNTETGLSQVHEFYIGFGSDSTETASPDLVDYMSTGNKRFFMKRHEGIGIDELFYIFIKAVSKAGVNTVVTVGPVLIDETPPVVRELPVINITGHDIILGWDNDTFYDLEQTEEINQVMMQVDHGSNHASPVMEWRLDHSKSCSGYTGGCFTFPVQRLQRQDTDLGLEFHAVLYVYNNAGHYTHVTTPTFRVPSRYPPGNALLLDIDPDDADISRDVNVHFTPNVLCARWTGFKHHERVMIYAGIGSVMYADDSVPFHKINNTHSYCIRNVSTTSGGKYFFSIRASCSGGQTISSSNGVTIFNETALMESVTVHVGVDTFKQSVRTNLSLSNTTSSILFEFPHRLMVGRCYRITLTGENDSIALNDTHFKSTDVIMSRLTLNTDSHTFYIRPLVQNPKLKLCKNGSNVTEAYTITLDACQSGIIYQPNTNSVASHWSTKAVNASILTFEASIVASGCANMSTTCTGHISPFTKTDTNHSTRITGLSLHSGVVYKTAIRPCKRCENYALSGGIMIDNEFPSGDVAQADMIASTTHTSCHAVKISWNPFSSISGIVLYKWTIAADDKAVRQLTSWRSLIPPGNQNKTVQVSTCVEIPVHPHSHMFACVRAYNAAGLDTSACKRLNVSDANEYDSHTVYDFDTSDKNWKKIKQVLHSAVLGDTLSLLHDNEMDFGKEATDVAGAVIYANERDVTWYLMATTHIPVSCNDERTCVMSATTTTGYVEFDRSQIPHNTLWYICAYSNVTQVEREFFTERLEEIRACSNGFIIDTVPPGGGAVHVTNTGGYIVDTTAIEITWNGFSFNADNTYLAYESEIQRYELYIGSRSGRDDLMHRTTYDGTSSSMILRNASFKDGTNVYVTVTAFDHAGNNVTVVSQELTVDTTVPSVGGIQLQSDMGTGRYVGSDTVSVYLMGFHDTESGIRDFSIGVGSQTDTMDIIPESVYTTDHVELRMDNPGLHDGHTYFINVMVTNRAGLSSGYISTSLILDRSAPIGGHVIDGRAAKDVDYQTDTSHIHSSWRGFSDPHSRIYYYRVALGTEPYIDDVRAMVDVGLSTDTDWNATFVPGTRYYTTVEACNWAERCRTVTSDGVVLDNSPPIPGIITVTSRNHQKYVPHSKSVHVEWVGFEDSQSGLDHFDVCIGTAPLSCDLHPWFNCLLSSSTIKTGLNLPNNMELYATVKATNKAGLYVRQASDTFRVDNTPPVLVAKPSFLTDYTSLSGFPAQWERSVLRVFWKFEDAESPVVRHIITLLTHHDGHTPVENIDIGAENTLTISLENTTLLHNGDKYRVSVTSCNGAGLCTTAVSDDLLIDSTPPHLGGLKPPMTWYNWEWAKGDVRSTVSLSWYGFLDQESGIGRYYITIGRTYSGQELSNGTLSVLANNTIDVSADSFNLTDAILPDDKLVISIWAENTAGLQSSISRITVNALATTTSSVDVSKRKGILEIQKHSCDAHYCNKDCTCAVVGQPCVDVKVNTSCTELSASDVVRLRLATVAVFGGMSGQQTITTSSSCLTGHWRMNTNSISVMVKRFEWSMGILHEPIGDGIFGRTERPWQDVGLRTDAIHCLPLDGSLIHNRQYVMYVRAWYTRDQYAVFHSTPITVDQTAPDTRKGGFVKDSDGSCVCDYDYIDWTSSITGCWNNVFLESQGSILYYTVALGTAVNSDDVYSLTNVGLQTNHTVTNVSLAHGTRYYFTITAYNTVGLHTSVGSDGFVVDTDSPLPGVVFTTTRHSDVSVQSSNTTFSLSWHGFTDHHSGIRSYHVAVVEARDIQTVTQLQKYKFQKVGLQNKVAFTSLRLTQGVTYYGVVYAVDAAGHVSNTSASRGVMIDATPPVGYTCQSFNTIANHDTHNSMYNGYNVTMTHSFVSNQLYKVSGVIYTAGAEVWVLFELARLSMMLPTAANHDGTRVFEYNFLPPVTGKHDVILDIQTSDNVTMTAMLQECVAVEFADSEAVQIQQISDSRVAVNVQVSDKESSLYNVLVGAGTSPGGFQVRVMSPVRGGNNGVISADLPHGSPVYVTVIAENLAGLRATFHGGPITMDHTPPDITDVDAHVTYNVDMTLNVTSQLVIVAEWQVAEPESSINKCFCNLAGLVSGGIDGAMTTVSNGTTCTIPIPDYQHGQRFSVTVTCVNTVQLATKATSRQVVISSRKPRSDNAHMEFISTDVSSFVTAGKFGNEPTTTAFQANDTCVHLAWTGFSDRSGLHHYEYRLLTDNRTLVDWTSSGLRTHILLPGLIINDGAQISGNVRAVNRGSYHSDTMAADIIVDGREPKLSGHSMKIDIRDYEVRLDWRGVFIRHSNIPVTYSLAVGSKSGYSDLADVLFTDKETYDVALPEYSILTPVLNEVHVVVTCTYATGMYVTYRTRAAV